MSSCSRCLSFLIVFILLPIAVMLASDSKRVRVKMAGDSSKALQIYSIDVEGGQSTLIVSPSGESLLIDAGWPGFNGRDVDRIVSAAKTAGLKQIDDVLITHFHRDHVGGVPQLVDRFRIGTFIDHGENREDSDVTRDDYAAYLKAITGHKRIIAKPGDHLPIKGIDVLVLTADGNHIQQPLSGAGQPNPACASEPKPQADTTENARSLGTLITYGKFRMLDLGDLTKNKELEIMCPNNLIGKVDLLIVSHHGLNQSNTNALVAGVHPEAAIMNNGAHKGGSPDAWQIVRNVVGPDRLWQLHYAVDGGAEHNVPEKFIANPDEKTDAGHDIRVHAFRDGKFEILNTWNDAHMTYSSNTAGN